MGINLYPYNYYCLYLAIGFLIVFLLITAKKILSLPKALKNVQPVLDALNKQTTLIGIKTEAMNEKQKENEKYMKAVKIALPVLFAIYTIYRDNENYKGIQGMMSAAKTYAKRDSEQKKLIRTIKRSL